MLQSFEVRNFRCFDKVELKDLKTVNVITGDNASGKSTLLEAFSFGLKAMPDHILWLNQLRGIISTGIINPMFPFAAIHPAMAPQNFKNTWEHWFRSFTKDGKTELSDNISIRYTDTDKKTYSLDVSFGGSPVPVMPPAQIAETAPTKSIIPIVFERKVNGALTKQFVTLNPQGVIQLRPTLPPLGPGVFIFTSVINYSETDSAAWFSQLQTGPDADRNKVEQIVGFITQNFPLITGLQVLSPNGMQGMYASMQSGEIRRLQLVSSGIYKIITILLACASLRNGVILIDEVENGIFYEKYGFVWSVLYKFAKESGNQLFITSHSAECLESLAQVIGDNVDDFSLLRTERENGKYMVRHISGASMKAALKRKSEIRGTSNGSEVNKE